LVSDEPPDPVTSTTKELDERAKEVNGMAKAQEMIYAVVGAGDFTVQKVRDLSKVDRKSSQNVYKDFVKRGKRLSTGVKNSAPTKQAIERTKTARTQVKAATTSVGKAVKANAKATRTAVKAS
jgi:hypothetical protein